MANKFQKYALKQRQSLPLEYKIILSERRIIQWFDHWEDNVYVSFSGGKDSTVLADIVARLCKRYGWKLYLLFVNTGLEYPEIQKFAMSQPNVVTIRPQMRFDEVIKKYGYPEKIFQKIVELYFNRMNLSFCGLLAKIECQYLFLVNVPG